MTIAQHKIRSYMQEHKLSQRKLSLQLGYCHNYINIMLSGSIPETKELDTIEEFFGIHNDMHDLKSIILRKHYSLLQAHEEFKEIYYISYATMWRLSQGYTTSRKDLLKALSMCYNLNNEWIEEYKES